VVIDLHAAGLAPVPEPALVPPVFRPIVPPVVAHSLVAVVHVAHAVVVKTGNTVCAPLMGLIVVGVCTALFVHMFPLHGIHIEKVQLIFPIVAIVKHFPSVIDTVRHGFVFGIGQELVKLTSLPPWVPQASKVGLLLSLALTGWRVYLIQGGTLVIRVAICICEIVGVKE
jgi:hypothetical protein